MHSNIFEYIGVDGTVKIEMTCLRGRKREQNSVVLQRPGKNTVRKTKSSLPGVAEKIIEMRMKNIHWI